MRWDFRPERFSLLLTIPSGGCQPASSTGCSAIRQVTVCPLLQGNGREWPAWSSNLWPASRCASFEPRTLCSRSMPKVDSTPADSKSSNLPSWSRSLRPSRLHRPMRATSLSSTRQRDSSRKGGGGFRRPTWRARSMRPHWGNARTHACSQSRNSGSAAATPRRKAHRPGQRYPAGTAILPCSPAFARRSHGCCRAPGHQSWQHASGLYGAETCSGGFKQRPSRQRQAWCRPVEPPGSPFFPFARCAALPHASRPLPEIARVPA